MNSVVGTRTYKGFVRDLSPADAFVQMDAAGVKAGGAGRCSNSMGSRRKSRHDSIVWSEICRLHDAGSGRALATTSKATRELPELSRLVKTEPGAWSSLGS